MHPDLEPLAFLIGTWRGTGRGAYPTISPFEYREEITFAALGPKPVITYGQRTWRATDHVPLHAETGYLRPVRRDDAELDHVEAVIAQPTGISEVSSGPIDGTSYRVRSESIGLTTTAVRVDSVERSMEVEGDTLRNRLWMGAVGQSHQLHLDATLHRLRG